MSFSYHQSNELKVFTMTSHVYPSPHSPPNEQDILLNTPLQQNNYEDWMIQNHVNLCAYSNNGNSEASSSSGIRTPDLGLSDNSQLFGFTSLLNPTYLPASMQQQQQQQQQQQTLSHHEQMILLQEGYSGNHQAHDNLLLTAQPPYKQQQQQQQQQQQHFHDNSTIQQLSREQLIQRVVQLEMERSDRSPMNNASDDGQVFYYAQHIIDEKKDPSYHNIKIEPLYTHQIENTTEMYSCLWVQCSAQAPSLEKLMAHICETHIGSGKATYFCEWRDCARNKKPFMKRHKMHNHMRTHTGERPFVCTVIGCNKTFSRPDSLSTHIKTHSDIRPYLCSMPGCDKAYFHSRSLRKHIKSTHLKKPSLAIVTASARRKNPTTAVSHQHQQASPHYSLQFIPNNVTSFY